jgi:EAL and modified HD-GYP domain-containing signal transduction protein
VDVFVARQPIFDRQLRVFGYELLFRSGFEQAFDGTDPTRATSQVITASFFALGVERIVGRKRAFVNFNRELLLRDCVSILPRRVAAVELLESVRPDREVLAACRRIKELGYLLVLDDVVSLDPVEPLLELADIVKVDYRKAEQLRLVRRGRQAGIQMLAEKIETQEELRQALEMGYDLFQGYFLARPMTIVGREIPAFKLHYIQILQEVSRPELDYPRLEALIKQELSLSYKQLRYINSAAFGWRRPIESVKQALVLLGEAECRKWLSLVALPALAQDKPEELVIQASVRAQFLESLADWVGLAGRRADLFFLGMFSMLDAILDQPMEEVLRGISLADDVRDVLLGQAGEGNRLAEVYALVRAYEAADWDRVTQAASALRLPAGSVATLYIRAVEWADEAFRSGGAGVPKGGARARSPESAEPVAV